jgi:hypothetical protein
MVEIFVDNESGMVKVVIDGVVLKEDFRTNFDISNTINQVLTALKIPCAQLEYSCYVSGGFTND